MDHLWADISEICLTNVIFINFWSYRKWRSWTAKVRLIIWQMRDRVLYLICWQVRDSVASKSVSLLWNSWLALSKRWARSLNQPIPSCRWKIQFVHVCAVTQMTIPTGHQQNASESFSISNCSLNSPAVKQAYKSLREGSILVIWFMRQLLQNKYLINSLISSFH